MTEGGPGRFRPDIEGLRAVAVGVVLLYHARLAGFHGGYVGVDVFFVVSGFLITRLLLGEHARRGGISLPGFWARRIRRLLPASILVIVATLIAAHWLIDPLAQRDLAWDATWSSLFSMNLALTRRGVDYLRAGLAPSPLRHDWSLSLEEQFYLVWPLVTAVALRIGRRAGSGARSVLVGVVVGGWTASLLASAVLTRAHATFAYYMLPTRAFELLTGAALALGAPALARLGAARPTTVDLAGWVGLAAVLASAVGMTDRTPFPGVAALVPVLGTAAVIVAGVRSRSAGPAVVLSAAPLQWVGARSYAIYLWHWPALVMLDARYGPLSVGARLGVLAGTLAVSAVSYRLVEHPVRHSAYLAEVPARSYAAGAWMVAGALGVAVVTMVARPELSTTTVVAAPTLITVTGDAVGIPGSATAPSSGPTSPSGPTSSPPSVQPGPTGSTGPAASPGTTGSTAPAGPAASSPRTVAAPGGQAALLDELDRLIAANQPLLAQSVGITQVPANLNPGLGRVRGDKPAVYDNGCILDPGQSVPKPCVYGDPNGTTTVVLYGDSHAAQWFEAMRLVAERHRWRLVVMTKKRCPSAAIPTQEMTTECFTWRDNVVARIGQLHPDLVVMSGYRYKAAGWTGSMSPDRAWERGLNDTLTAMRPLARQILVLGDTPTPVGDIPSCVSSHVRAVRSCVMTRQQATRPGRLAAEQRAATAHQASFIPTSDWLCTAKACPVIVGNVLAYRDDSHITSATARLLVPYVDVALRAALAR